MSEVIIHDGNFQDHLEYDCPVTGETKGKGCVPRDFNTHPVGYLVTARPFDLPLIPESEWQSRLDVLMADKAQLSDIRMIGNNGGMIDARDQGSYGFCWAHSSVSAMLLARAKAAEPYEDLSAFAVAAVIKDFRNEGGFGSESLEFIAQRGVPTSQFWPQQSMQRANDNPSTWANAALHKYTNWRDLDPNDMKNQLITCLLMGCPVVTDFNWWSHSVCTMDLVSLNPFTTRILNSWGNGWSDHGSGLLQGSKAIPDAALVALVDTPSNA
jgi:hypothetical protein